MKNVTPQTPKQKHFSYIIFFLLSLFLYSCNDTETRILEYSLKVSSNNVAFDSGSAAQEISIETDLEATELVASVASEGKSWCSCSVVDNILKINVTDNLLNKKRVTVITLTAGNHKQDLLVTQNGYGFPKDKLIKVSKVETTSFAEGFEAVKMIDGDPNSYFNSQFGEIAEWPFILDFYFNDIDKIDYLTHIPRQDSGNRWGAIGKFELWVATESNTSLTKYGEYDFKQIQGTSSTLKFENAILKPTQIQFKVMSGYQNRVSCGEMQFFEKTSDIQYNYLEVFTDHSCSELKQGLTEKELDKIPNLFYRDLALNIFKGTYEKEFRVQEYRPYQHPNIMAATNKTERYSLKDNATGIYVQKPNDELILFVGDTKGQTLSLNIRDYQTNKEENYTLAEGLNIFSPSISGLLYIYNHTEDKIPLLLNTDAEKTDAASKTVKINIVTGAINGYFDIQKHNADDWTRILTKYGKHTEIDVLGKHCHVVWRTSDYRDNNTDIVLMTNYLDAITDQQKEFMGLYYYNKAFNNRMFMHVDYAAPAAYATAYRTAYSLGYTNVFCTENGFRTRLWVVGHEVGHINQVRPGVKWAGTTEVTNNLYAMYNQQRILGEAERLNSGSDSYEVAFKEIIENKQPWVLPDNYGRHITKLAPFWQLKLYFVDILKQEHFYHDLFEHYRLTEDLNQSVLGDNYHGMLQLDFVRQVCNIGKLNMLEFFEEWGFLRPIDRVINDYGDKTLKITQEQIDALKNEINIKNYPKPSIKVQDLTDSNYRQYIQ